MTFDPILALMLFTVGGGLIHASYNLWKTRKIWNQGYNPYKIPRVYQQHTDNRDAGVGLGGV